MIDVREATPEESAEIAYRDLRKAMVELDSECPDMGHVYMYVNSAMIWLRGFDHDE